MFLFALALPASAADLPGGIPVPPGRTAVRVQYYDYEHDELGYTDGHNQSVHERPVGHTWKGSIDPGPIDAAALTAWGAALTAAGWTVMSAPTAGTLVAHRDSDNAWFKANNGGFVVIEASPPPALTLPAPAAAPEALVKDTDVPYLPAIAGTTRTKWSLDNRLVETTHGEFIGKPLLTLTYDGGKTWSGTETHDAWAAALPVAGWQLVSGQDGVGTLIAHYTQGARDIWLKITPMGQSFALEIGDPGLQATQDKLKSALDATGHIALYGIYFDTDQSTLKADSEATLEQVLALLKANPELVLEVQGHTDDTGDHAHNLTLSQSRAATVVTWLVSHGIDEKRLTAVGYASDKPVADNKTAEGRALNRRVELSKR